MKKFKTWSQNAPRTLSGLACCWTLALLAPDASGADAAGNYAPQGGEYPVAGVLPGDQVFPDVSLKPNGGFLVWQDNRTDGSGSGISAQRLDSSLSATLSSFRVNQQGANDQDKPRVALLNGGGAVFVWQGGRQGYQRIYARFLSASNTWATGDILVNTFTNAAQVNPAVTTLANGDVMIVWGSFNQQSANSLQDVYAQRFSSTGQKLGNEFLVNLTTAYNQRSPAVAALSDGKYVVMWVSEQQRSGFNEQFDWTNGVPPAVIGTPSVDIYARLFHAGGAAASDELLINNGMDVCANPSVAPSSDGGFIVAWMQKDVVVRSNSWDVFARPVNGAGAGGTVRRVNTMLYGDQIAPRVSAIATDYLVVWMSLGQDGAREGVYGQFLRGNGSPAGTEFRVNTTTISQQMHPALASDGNGRFLVAWTSFVGGPASFDLYAQRYASTTQPIPAPDPPFVSVLSSNALSITWPALAGFSVANYEVYADGAATPTATVASNSWTMGGLGLSSTHYFRLAYVLTDGRHSPLSGATTNTTYGALTYGGIPYEWMVYYFGGDLFSWPSPFADSDGDRIRLQHTAQGLYLNWNTQPGLMYQVQVSTNLGSWSNLGGSRFAAGYLDSMYAGGANAGYYRVLRLR
ncbi:MAG: hypothetical protein MUF81_02040 [Verrucomicrobia bacterium]|nr:hypothetical protein [Verrucomicrobiota bacterium]